MEPEILQWLVGGGAGGGGLAMGMIIQQMMSKRNGGVSMVELQVRLKSVEERLISQESKLDRILESWRSRP